jgi:hypothetical protein
MIEKRMKGSKNKKKAIETKGKKREKRQDGRKDEWKDRMKGITKETKTEKRRGRKHNNNKISVSRCFAFNQFLTIQFPG